MRKAIEMAELALASDETPVGCVFVHQGEVIGRGINGTNASLNVRYVLAWLCLRKTRPSCPPHPPPALLLAYSPLSFLPTVRPSGINTSRDDETK